MGYFITGWLAAIFLMLLIIVPSGVVERSNTALGLLEACEAELPRNQHCKLIAVPEKEAQDD